MDYIDLGFYEMTHKLIEKEKVLVNLSSEIWSSFRTNYGPLHE